jgi:hypothetical protein
MRMDAHANLGGQGAKGKGKGKKGPPPGGEPK